MLKRKTNLKQDFPPKKIFLTQVDPSGPIILSVTAQKLDKHNLGDFSLHRIY